MTDYIYRPYEESDADRAVALYSLCFKKARKKDDWVWQHHSCPYGQSSVVCEHGQEIVGFYGVVLRPFVIQNRETMVGHVLDVMAHPDHEWGIFMNSAKAAFSAARVRGVGALIGFPNKFSWPGHKRANWRDVGTRMILRNPLERVEGTERDEGDFVIDKSTLEEMETCSQEIESMFMGTASRHEIVADRRWKWLRWRYGSRPGVDYSALTCRSAKDDSLIGLMITTTRRFEGSKVGHIIDWLKMPAGDGALRLLESTALRDFASEGCEYAQCLDNRDSEKEQPSDPAWISEEGRKLKFTVRSTDDAGSGTPQAGLSQCYLSLGDCDIF